MGGVLAPNGDIHFVPSRASRGQKIDISGVVSTYSLAYTASSAYAGGVLAPNGDIYFIPVSASRGQVMTFLSGTNYTESICQSSFFYTLKFFLPTNSNIVTNLVTVSIYSKIYAEV